MVSLTEQTREAYRQAATAPHPISAPYDLGSTFEDPEEGADIGAAVSYALLTLDRTLVNSRSQEDFAYLWRVMSQAVKRVGTQHLFVVVHLIPFYAGYDMRDPASSGYISWWTSVVRNATQRTVGSPDLAGVGVFPGWGTDGDPWAAERRSGGVIVALLQAGTGGARVGSNAHNAAHSRAQRVRGPVSRLAHTRGYREETVFPGGQWAVNGRWKRAASEGECFGACPEDVVKEVPRGEGVLRMQARRRRRKWRSRNRRAEMGPVALEAPSAWESLREEGPVEPRGVYTGRRWPRKYMVTPPMPITCRWQA